MKERTRAAYETWFRAAGIVLVVTALATFLSAFYSRKFHLETGRAAWIWVSHPLDEKKPVAFFAVRDVAVPPDPPFVRLRIACDADWTFYLNGVEVAGGGATSSPRLVSFDLSDRARKGELNRFVVALRSASGVGGMLASIDYAPLRENDVVTDRSWSICREWSESLLSGTVTCGEEPLVLGQPPFGRWNYPESSTGRPYANDGRGALPAADVRQGAVSRSEIRVIDGLAVASATELSARRFDFGLVEGRGRVTLPHPVSEVTVIDVRYADTDDELRAVAREPLFVFAPGESSLTDPVAREFRFMAVAHDTAEAAVVEESGASP